MKLKLLIITLFISSFSKAQTINEKSKISHENIINSNKENTNSLEVISYGDIENPPTSLNCKKKWNKKKKKERTLKYILSHFAKKINISELAEDLGLSGITKIEIQFIIDKQGDIANIQIKASHEEIKKEITKVVSTLGKFIAGSEKGENKNVSMNIPLIFRVE